MFSNELSADLKAARRYSYVSLSPQEVDQLARDIDANKVHGTWLMEAGQPAGDCFLPLALLPPGLMERFKRQNIIHGYEYMDKAADFNSKGQPTFMSVRFLDKRDMLRVEKRLNEIRSAIGRTGK